MDEQRNIVLVHNYGLHQNEVLEYNLAPKILTPAFRIGEVAKLFGKKPATLRKYERDGLIDKPNRYRTSSKSKDTIRLYSPSDVSKLVDFFHRRNPVGRPAATNPTGINKELIQKKLQTRYKP